MTSTCILFPAELLDAFDERGWSWGYLNLRHDSTQGVATVAQAWDSDREQIQRLDGLWSETRHYLRRADIKAFTGIWYRADPDLHLIYDQIRRRTDTSIPVDYFKSFVNGWVDPGLIAPLVVTVTTPASGVPAVTAWRVDRVQAVPELISVVDGRLSPLDVISGEWPVDTLRQKRATIVGVGSIGSAVADTLARAGIGALTLVDYDRLEQRNLARHILTDRDLGRRKVDALAEHLGARPGSPVIETCPINVLSETDVLRPLVAASDIVVCAADGVAARRVCNHVSRRARTPLVLVAVVEDGAFGEVIRVRSRTGCMFCLRLEQDERGVMNPEPNIDLGYGTGTSHRPMTAAPPDLTLMADLASKAAISTILERSGRWNQRLPGDYAIVTLQPKPDYEPPFDVEAAGSVRWFDLPARRTDCPTCSP
jgi:molybdopterin/thiamine biosynthesis adenylyltransferase